MSEYFEKNKAFYNKYIKYSEVDMEKTLKEDESYIYVLLCHHSDQLFIKIGYSRDPRKRMKRMHTANPFEIILISTTRTKYYVNAEKYLHQILDSCRINKNKEWFEVNEETIDYVCYLLSMDGFYLLDECSEEEILMYQERTDVFLGLFGENVTI